jgi:F-box and WD-40 domain protein CDC4
VRGRGPSSISDRLCHIGQRSGTAKLRVRAVLVPRFFPLLTSFNTAANRRRAGRLLGAYRAPSVAPEESGVVTSLALGANTVVVGLANSTIQTFDVRTGVRTRSLKGHSSGVWAVCLVEPGGYWAGGPEGDSDEEDNWPADMLAAETPPPSSPERSMETENLEDLLPSPSRRSEPTTPPRRRAERTLDSLKPPLSPWYQSLELGTLDDPHPGHPKPSDAAFTSEGWGQSNTLVVSGGCDKDVRVWELPSGYAT